MIRDNHSTRARNARAWAESEDVEELKLQRWLALAHNWQTGNVRLHFFLKARHLSQAGPADLPDVSLRFSGAGPGDEERVLVDEEGSRPLALEVIGRLTRNRRMDALMLAVMLSACLVTEVIRVIASLSASSCGVGPEGVKVLPSRVCIGVGLGSANKSKRR